MSLIYLMPLFSFYTSYKNEKTKDFLFLGGIEREPLREIDTRSTGVSEKNATNLIIHQNTL